MDFQRIKKSQVSMEFVFLVGLAFMIMIIFISATRSEFDDLRFEEERIGVQDVAVTIQHELIMASDMRDGYTRNFEIPEEISGKTYSIQIINTTLVVYTTDYEYVVNVPPIIGSVDRGSNKINKSDSFIYVT